MELPYIEAQMHSRGVYIWFSGCKTQIGLACIYLFACLPLQAVNPGRLISQYAHTAWRVQDGYFSGPPFAITQTADGYIWVGTMSGIVRFDGVQFVPWIPPGAEQLRGSAICALLGTTDGSLWIGTENELWQWNHGRLTLYKLAGLISSISTTRNQGGESVWITRMRRQNSPDAVCEAGHGRFHCYGPSSGIPVDCCASLVQDSAGDFWMGGETALVKWTPRSASAHVWPISGAIASQTNSFVAPLPDGSAWIGVDLPGPGRGLQFFSGGKWNRFASGNWDGSAIDARALLLDQHNELWVGTISTGLYRIRAGKIEHFGGADGLSGDYVCKIFEDREGNLWVTTSKGIDCFRNLAVSTFSTREGLTTTEIDTVLASRDGTVWAGGDRSLNALRAGGITSFLTGKGLPGVQVTSLLEDSQGRLWVGLDHTMSIMKDGRFTQIRRPDGRELGFVVGMAEDVDHNVWAEITSTPRELIRIHNLKVQDVFAVPLMPAARKVAADPAGGIWLGLMNGDIARYRRGKLDTFHFSREADTLVNQIAVNRDGSVWGATRFGLIGWRAGKQQILTAKNGLPCDSINAFLRDDAGALWLYTRCGLVQIAERELQNWWNNPSAVLPMRVFDATDGFQAGLAPFQKSARSPDGKLWFANQVGLQMIEPAHLENNAVLPPVHIEEAQADGHTFAPSAQLRFPALTRDISIRYTALSFVNPRKVRFRYKLEGQDNTWQEAGTRREALYNNLGPSTYRFRVIACNNDGLWNNSGDSLTFTIVPAYYQTRWFYLLCAAALGGALWLLHMLRLKQATEQVQQRLWGRLEERERIARELHDTLLQGFQGLVLRFQAVMKVLPEQGPARPMMEQVLDRADGVLLEGRQSVRDLREEGLNGNALPEMLTRFGEELSQDHASRFSLSILGEPQPLARLMCREIARIAREALVNAFRHAGASMIEAELTYSGAGVSLRIRDDGAGMDAEILNRGKAGHWGVSGMRERAQEIGAQLNIWSQSGAGTEIELNIPANIAYPRAPAKLPWKKLPWKKLSWKKIGLRKL